MKNSANILIVFLLILMGCGENKEEEQVKKVIKEVPKVEETVVEDEKIGNNLTKISDPKKFHLPIFSHLSNP